MYEAPIDVIATQVPNVTENDVVNSEGKAMSHFRYSSKVKPSEETKDFPRSQQNRSKY